MAAPSSHISLRINEEDLMLLDAKIGSMEQETDLM